MILILFVYYCFNIMYNIQYIIEEKQVRPGLNDFKVFNLNLRFLHLTPLEAIY